MVATPAIRASQGYVTAITSGATPKVEVAQGYVQAIASFPAEAIDVSQSYVTVVTEGATPTVEVSQYWTTVVARGRVADPKVRVFTFTLDGHDFYVIRLGNDETLVYDLHSQQWYNWGSGESDLWRAYDGMNWQGGDYWSANYGSSTLVGDDGNGAVYFLDPDQPYDDHPIIGATRPQSFLRVASGMLTFKGYDSIPCYGVQVMGSIGTHVTETPVAEEAGTGLISTSGDADSEADVLLVSGDMDTTGNDALLWQILEAEETDYSDVSVTLSYSDDKGNSYVTLDPVRVSQGEYNTRLTWRSLGSMKSPGRIFRITDTRALKRIDSLDTPDNNG